MSTRHKEPDRPERSGPAGRIRQWLRGGDPDGMAKIAQWARADSGRPEGYTYGMMPLVTGLSILAAVLYPLTKGYGSVVALVLAILVLLGRHAIERQVVRAVSDLQEAERQYKRTRNMEYVEFTRLRAAGLLEDNKMLTASTRAWLRDRLTWAETTAARAERREATRSRRRRGPRTQQGDASAADKDGKRPS